MTDNIYFIIVGVFAGIIAMRFVAQIFTIMINKYPSLEASAFYVICILGIKLIISGIIDYLPNFDKLVFTFDNHTFDIVFGLLMILIFIFPIIKNFNKCNDGKNK